MEERTIKIFKTFEEQEDYHIERMRHSTPEERFAALYKMQQFTNALHKKLPEKKAIIIHYGYFEP